jgi:hypothetical protein
VTGKIVVVKKQVNKHVMVLLEGEKAHICGCEGFLEFFLAEAKFN